MLEAERAGEIMERALEKGRPGAAKEEGRGGGQGRLHAQEGEGRWWRARSSTWAREGARRKTEAAG